MKYLDHTHADAVETISNSLNGQEFIKEVYPNYLIVPYITPGFILAHEIYKMVKDTIYIIINTNVTFTLYLYSIMNLKIFKSRIKELI